MDTNDVGSVVAAALYAERSAALARRHGVEAEHGYRGYSRLTQQVHADLATVFVGGPLSSAQVDAIADRYAR